MTWSQKGLSLNLIYAIQKESDHTISHPKKYQF